MDPRSVPMAPGTTSLNAFLWFIQIFLAVQYLFHGWLFASPPAAWAEAIAASGLNPGLRQFIGIAEILAAISLVLPALTRILSSLTPLASLGLAVALASATLFQLGRDEEASA